MDDEQDDADEEQHPGNLTGHRGHSGEAQCARHQADRVADAHGREKVPVEAEQVGDRAPHHDENECQDRGGDEPQHLPAHCGRRHRHPDRGDDGGGEYLPGRDNVPPP